MPTVERFDPKTLRCSAGYLLVGGVLALMRPGRAAQMYLFGNARHAGRDPQRVGRGRIRLAISGEEPNPAVVAPLYLALVLAGLGLGMVVGARRRIAQP
jgi:hypothetical protein